MSPGGVLAFCQRPLVLGLLFLLAALGAYGPALRGEPIWDDTYLIGENPFFRSPVFGLEVFRHYLFFDSFSTYYRPVQNWSYIVDYWLWHGNAAAYHFTNILLHAGTALLLCLLLRKLLPALLKEDVPAQHVQLAATLIALVWLVHPVHNAAVAYISGRADSLAAFFALLAWLFVLRAEEERANISRVAWSGSAALAMLVALCSKEIALIWLVLFLAHHWWAHRRQTLRINLVVTIAVLAVLAGYAVLHSLPPHRAPMEDAPPPPFEARVLLMLRALGDYTRLLLFPGKLYMERSLSDPIAYQSVALWRAHVGSEWLSVFGVLAVVGAVWLCRSKAQGRGLRLAGAAWFVVAFLPISNLFPLNAEVAEHWIYLASIGFFIFAAGAAFALPQRMQRWSVAVVGVAVIALSTRTAIRSGDWVDAETFCLRTIQDGGATPRILSTLASIYGSRGDWPKQEQVLRRTLERFPDFIPARISLGICLAKQGHAAQAEGLLNLAPASADESARRFPRTWPAALNLARLRREASDPASALAILREARTRFPETWPLVKYESEIVEAADGPKAALPAVERYASERWWHLDSRLVLARLRLAGGDSTGALAALNEAARLDLYDGGPLAGIAQIELGLQHADAALAAQCEAIAREPARPTRYLELGAILEKLGRSKEAGAALHKAQLLAANADKP